MGGGRLQDRVVVARAIVWARLGPLISIDCGRCRRKRGHGGWWGVSCGARAVARSVRRLPHAVLEQHVWSPT